MSEYYIYLINNIMFMNPFLFFTVLNQDFANCLQVSSLVHREFSKTSMSYK